MDKKGLTLIELLIVIAIIGILAMIAVPAYIGQQSNAARTEAYSNLQNLRLLEEQFFAEQARYTVSLGTCAQNNPNNALQIRQGGAAPDPTNALSGFNPGSGVSYSYCIETNIDLTGAAQTPCFRASAFGNTGTRVAGDVFRIDCNNNRTF
jgi:prepilin-type N-terminal cleavage/methylation domain-containing protein